MAGGICHVEFPATDLGSISDFYSKSFGWKITPMDEGYTLWQSADEKSGGGFSTPQPGAPLAVVAYIEVDDIEASLATIGANGGSTIMPKMEIGGGHGFMALFSDPAGNTVGLWSKPLEG